MRVLVRVLKIQEVALYMGASTMMKKISNSMSSTMTTVKRRVTMNMETNLMTNITKKIQMLMKHRDRTRIMNLNLSITLTNMTIKVGLTMARMTMMRTVVGSMCRPHLPELVAVHLPRSPKLPK